MAGGHVEREVPSCPKRMVFGPCGGVHDDGSCEVDSRPCPFAAPGAAVVRWDREAPVRPAPESTLLAAARAGAAVVTDLTIPPFDAAGLGDVVEALSGSCDAVLVGEHQNRPDFPPSLMAALVTQAGGVPWVTLACRDRNRVVLEQELAGLAVAGVDGVLCVTGDARAAGMRPEVTQVFDLDGTQLAALASQTGHAVAVPEAPSAAPRQLRPARLFQKQAAGAHLAVLNHVGSPAQVAGFVAAARAEGLTIPVIAGVAVYTDERSARVLQRFPGLDVDPAQVERVLGASDVREAGIETAVREARALLAVAGVSGVNLSGLASEDGALAGAHVKAEIGRRIKEGR
ncbi:methylenetetrahydrofolate reductase C-terminal domain-containing protein [Nocardioides sp. cx-173]|uniref:methylenetetrahydrofolate reductase C-terminal domain-containing protein n=1 Tax=Nocardioides sp. cx-173 TaxID=2898796 RepID=UPI001E28567A|nr:methylenetetrahydrofolate reductase C-terminal domain-containing protein [Nocardioides sp. cx-173]MCD4523552.1 methylenetetrahydrofolate reductase C-terminal domain-containing protein [Nocardioides sp. cx-173]UGB42110.1 methylenetetrahydrofolate reductase C-terminal domain-containing protein [Nocardioides sp. cx-173]